MDRPMADWSFDVEPPAPRADGWWFSVVGARRWEYGPFPDAQRAAEACHRVFHRWKHAAMSRGGWIWVSTSRRWVVTVPVGCEVAGRPFVHEACTRHTVRNPGESASAAGRR